MKTVIRPLFPRPGARRPGSRTLASAPSIVEGYPSPGKPGEGFEGYFAVVTSVARVS